MPGGGEVVELAATSVWGKETGEVADMIRAAAAAENVEYADLVERAIREYFGKHRLRAVGEKIPTRRVNDPGDDA